MHYQCKKTLEFPFIEKGVKTKISVEYDLLFSSKGELTNVYNEFGYSIEKNSEVFLKFKKDEKQIFKTIL